MDKVELFELLQIIIDQQAKDDGLWFEAETAPEAYLQQELRRIHHLIETGQMMV